MIHVVPINDAIEHVESPTCWCQPTKTSEDELGAAVYVHHSADGREADEPDALPPARRH